VLAGATHVIVAMPGATLDQQAQAMQLARQTGLAVMSLPGGSDLMADDMAA